MLKRKTIVLMVSAIALLGLVALLEGNRNVVGSGQSSGQQTDSSTDTNDPRRGESELLFDFAEDEVARLEVQRSEDTLVFEKLEDGTWEMTAPEVALAEPGAIAFLLSQITSPSTHTLSVSTSDLRDFGLQNPEATVVLTANDTIYQLTVGGDDFTGDQLYVRADPPAEAPDEAEQIKVHVVSGGMRNAVNRATPDWLMAQEGDADDANSDETAVREGELGEEPSGSAE